MRHSCTLPSSYALLGGLNDLHPEEETDLVESCLRHPPLYILCIYGTALGSPTPPPGDGHGSLPRPLWEWVGWLWMGGNAG